MTGRQYVESQKERKLALDRIKIFQKRARMEKRGGKGVKQKVLTRSGYGGGLGGGFFLGWCFLSRKELSSKKRLLLH